LFIEEIEKGSGPRPFNDLGAGVRDPRIRGGSPPPRHPSGAPPARPKSETPRGGARLAATRAGDGGGVSAGARGREGACPAGGRRWRRRRRRRWRWRGPGARRSVLCWNVRLRRARRAAADQAPPRPGAPDPSGCGGREDGRSRAGGLSTLCSPCPGPWRASTARAPNFSTLSLPSPETPATKKSSRRRSGGAGSPPLHAEEGR
jgi:hypothetical protein